MRFANLNSLFACDGKRKKKGNWHCRPRREKQGMNDFLLFSGKHSRKTIDKPT